MTTVYRWPRTATTDLVLIECWCGIPLAIPTQLNRQMARNSNFKVWCPLGHTMVQRDGNEKEIGRLERRLDAERARLVAERDQHEATRRSLTATKAVVTRTKRRIERGVCIHCHRTFADVARHMESKHPEVVQ